MLHAPLKTALAALAALLLAGSLAHAQQTTPTPTGTSRATRRAAKAAAATTPTAAQPTPPADGPQPLRPGDGPGPGPRPGDGPHHGKGSGPHRAPMQALSDFSGTLTGYLAGNDDQVYDSFGFKTATGPETVCFPRHLAQPLMAAAKAGSAVTITGFRDLDREGRPALHLVSLTAGGQTVRDTPPVRPATPPAEEAATVRGTVQRLAQDPRGRTNAVVVSDGTVLRLPPGAAEQLADKLKVGTAVAATGNLHALRPGEVAAKPVRVVRAQTITLDGVQFLVQ